jgi:Plasmid pRiA4b ORF-3-like protein
MIPQPSAVTPELAEAALNGVALSRARKLAEWIGAGQQLTSSGVLKPALAIEACRVLGIELPPGRLRTALDVNELMQAWEVACFTGYIIPSGSRVRATGRLADTAPQSVLGSWLRAASAELGLPDEPCTGCLTVLHELSGADGPLDLHRLAEAVRSAEPTQDEDAPCPDCGTVHDLPSLAAMVGYDEDDDDDDDDSLEHAESAVVCLVSYGAATALTVAPTDAGRSGEARVRLTELGRMLAESIFVGCAPSADADVAALLDVLSKVPSKIAAEMAAPWLAARSPAAAVGDLLAYAESADPALRMIAMAFAMGIGPGAAPAWREWGDRPGLGAYARLWLTERGEEVAEHPGDQAWLTVEAFTAASAALPPEVTPLVLGAALENADAGEAAEALSLISASGHPGAARFVESVTAASGIGLPAGRSARSANISAGDAYQLKITLRGVAKPPIWRRIAVPSTLPLDLLHEVIQQAMGWEDGHLHVFSTPHRDYGIPDPDLGYADERKVILAKVLARPGTTMRYTYDFGDDWEHDVVLEKVLPPDPGVGLSCLAGKGACPPEDCGGVWGYASLKEVLADPTHKEHEDLLDWLGLDSAADFDPAQFSLDEVNARLRQLL